MPSRSTARRTAEAARSALLATLAATAVCSAVVPSVASAQAAATIPDSAIPDPALRGYIKSVLAVPAGQEIPVADAMALQSLPGGGVQVPIASLTGLEHFPNLVELNIPYPQGVKNTYSDLTPIAGLTKLQNVTLDGASISDLGPLAGSAATLTDINATNNEITSLAGLPNLPVAKSVSLSYNKITDVDGPASLPSASYLGLSSNQVTDLSELPSLPSATYVSLDNNRIVDPAPLASKLDSKKVVSLDLAKNRITDASTLVPLGDAADEPLGNSPGYWETLQLGGNRIADFSGFRAWPTPLPVEAIANQTVYVGTYVAGGVTVPLKSSLVASPTTIEATEPATFDAATNLLTLTGSTTVERITAEPHWNVVFAPAPEATNPAAPTISGTPRVGNVLTAAKGTWIDGRTCASTDYQWYRDDVAIARSPYFDNGNPPRRPASGAAPSIGDGGNFDTYMVQPRDAGRRISVRVACAGTPAYARSLVTDVVDIDPAAPRTPTIQPLEGAMTLGAGSANSAVVLPRSYTLGDPTLTRLPFHIAALDADNKLVPPADLTVTVAPGQSGASTSVFDDGDLKLEGTGADRTLVMKASRVGTQTGIAIRVTAPTGESKTLTLGFLVSPASTPTSRNFVSFSDPSTAISVGGGHLLVADDERSEIGLFDASSSGRPKAEFRLDGGRGDELDYEASARKGDTVYWLGSHGNDSGGSLSRNRNSIYASTLTGTGANAKLAPKGVGYRNLRTDLLAWDVANGNRLGLVAAAADGMSPSLPTGFNIEAAEFSPDGSELLLGFRAPNVPASFEGGPALVVPVKNIEELTTAQTGDDTRKAQFGEPILLDLDGRTIRELRKNAADEYMILAGPRIDDGRPQGQSLWVWDGKPASKPLKLDTPLTGDLGTFRAVGFWEGIGELPTSFAHGATLGVILDQGDTDVYNRGKNWENKKDSNFWTRKSRHDVATIGRPLVAQVAKTDPGAFPAQATNTVGSPRKVTMTNDSFTSLNRVELTRLKITDTDGASRSDFLVSADDCSGEMLEQGKSCEILVRYAPSRTNATSTAQLEIFGNLPGGKTTILLTGTSTSLPKGEQGTPGTPGADGDDAAPAAPGRDGAPGTPGTDGQNGAQGTPGKDGAGGPKGDKGDQGPAGRDGTFSFTTTGANAASVRRGRTATVAFRVRNLTTATARSLKATTSTPKVLRASGLKSTGLKALEAGRARTIKVTFRVGRTAKVGTHRVRVQLTVDGARVSRTVAVRVTR